MMTIRALKLRPLYAPPDDLPDGNPPTGQAPLPDDLDEDLDLGDQHEDQLEADEEDGHEDPQPQDFDPPPQPRRRTSSDIVREAKNAAKRLQAENARIAAEMAQFRAERDRERAALDARTEEDRVALMTAEERSEYRLNKALDEMKRVQAHAAFVQQDAADRSAFEAKLPPKFRHLSSEVEAKLQEIRTTNRINIPRDTALRLVLGEKVLERAGGKPSTSRSAAPARRSPPPLNSRGDQGGDRRNNRSLEQRLENVPL